MMKKYIVVFKESCKGSLQDNSISSIAALGADVGDRLGIVNGLSVSMSEETAEKVKKLDTVEYIEEDQIVTTQ
ncbi:hypothetical protein BB560_003867 [Smittium megazygosporum]|uniref:Inhibitor I9 domain-containing protein n=1 Tax=Smittium megazygosporum TaxID=133381 RepID=A0A2T9Z330_9FUNG|nr:hypothetical protein BB560_005567 [Smittium megazygosporum]PVV01703.1 hypothetical protein BB560_003867 [Smittium megazygosporum]